MRNSTIKSLLLAAVGIAALQLTSCKKKEVATAPATEITTTTTEATAEPVEIATDDQLTTDLKDATKDFPTVTATAMNGEVTLTGSINRDRLPDLMQCVQQLHPKKVTNNLTINK